MLETQLALPLPAAIQEPQLIQSDCRDREATLAETVPTHIGELIPSNSRMPQALRGANIASINSTWQLVAQLTANIPLNEYNLPIYVYRPDMLDYGQIVRTLQSTPTTTGPARSAVAEAYLPAAKMDVLELEAHIDAAMLHLGYAEGFPTMPTGTPFWQQLDFEPRECYDMFIAYLELGGARQLSSMIGYPLELLQECFNLYYWSYRVKAFDLYRVAHHQKKKLQRMLKTEEDHFEVAERMLGKLRTYLDAAIIDEESVTPEKAVNMLEKLVKIQRISVGLPANGESKENNAPRSMTPVNVIMQQIAAGNGQTRNEVPTVDLLMEDPDAVDLAQELIIKMQKTGGGM